MRAVTPTNARPIFVYLLVGLLFMAAVGIAGAQPESPIPLPTHRSEAEARLVTVEQGDITLIERVLTVFKQSPLAYQTVDDMNVIVLYGPADAVKAAEEIIRQLDRPVHEESVVNVVFTVDILTNVKDLGGPIQDNAAAGVEAVQKDFPVQELFLMDRILMRA
jgi:type II secretory pathway component GspD/PulD (secretin)